VVAVLTGESVSAQTVSRLTRVLDQAVRGFHQRSLEDSWCYLVLDGVWLMICISADCVASICSW
jgi:transposase-like protein